MTKEAINTEPLESATAIPDLTPTKDDGSEYYLRKNRLFRITCSKVKDEIEGVCTINFKQPLPQFNSFFGKAFAVNRKQADSGEAYAILLDKRYPIRLAEINNLLGKQLRNFTNIIAAQIITTSISKGRVFAVVIEKPPGINITDFITKNGPMNPEFISRSLVPAIGDVISSLSRLGITHGRINANNVYIDDTGLVTVGECVADTCGYLQPILYEPIGRATAMAAGKGTGSSACDYHAMGVLVAVALRGKDPSSTMTTEAILDGKFESGTYKIVTEGLEIPSQMLDLLRGALTTRKADIWGAEELHEWIRGRRFNLLTPADLKEDGRPIIFHGKKYSSRLHLVHGMYLNWEEGKKFIKLDTLIRWIDRNDQDADLIERLEMASNRYGKDKDSGGFTKDDELLAQYIILLDPSGPIRLRDFSANIDGIGTSLADAFVTNNKHTIDAIQNIIIRNLTSMLPSTNNADITKLEGSLFTLQKCADLLRKTDLGFGIERCLYELNPTLACQSPPVIDDICFNSEELIRVLDSNENIGGKILDRHMAGFFSDRMDLSLKIHISSLTRFPELATNMHIQVLALLSLVQQTGNVGTLPKLAAKIYTGLKNVVDELHSKTIRQDIEDNLKKQLPKGVLSHLLRIISDPKSLIRDKIGFKKASSSYKSNAIQILKLSNSRAVNNIGYRYGLQLAVMISFFVATVVIITLLIKAF